MRLYQDSDLVVPIEWFFVPADREVVPFSHAFGSRIYDRDDGPPPAIGEQYSPVPWRGGKPPGPVATGGLCGSAEQWSAGARVDDPLPDVWPGTQVSRCCKRPPNVAFGGEAVGGFGLLPVCCDGVTLPASVVFVVTVVVGFCPTLDGVPFLCAATVETPPVLTFSPLWKSAPIDFTGTLLVFWIGCNPDLGGWTIASTNLAGDGDMWINTIFLSQSCLPWRLNGPIAGTGPPGAPCDLIEGECEVVPA